MALAGQILQIIMFLFKLYNERNKERAKKKAELGKELVDALAETDKAKRASSLNSIVVKLRQ